MSNEVMEKCGDVSIRLEWRVICRLAVLALVNKVDFNTLCEMALLQKTTTGGGFT